MNWIYIIVVYFGLGLLIFISPIGKKEVRKEFYDLQNTDVPLWKEILFRLILFSACVIVWPLVISSWIQHLRESKRVDRSLMKNLGITKFDDMNEIDIESGDMNVLPSGYGEFGLEVTNPIPSTLTQDWKNYCNRLRGPNNEKVILTENEKWMAPISSKPIESFLVTNDSGKELGIIYFSRYQKYISNKAPKGYSLAS